MTVDEALRKLELAGAPEANEVRRAYLRKVKAHPPERDPEGFRAVREAYELLKDGAAPPPEVMRMLARLQAGEVPELPPPSTDPPFVVAEPVSPEASPESGSSPTPGPAFPPQVDSLLEELGRAQQTDDPVAAAEAMRGLYARPELEGSPVPSPFFTLGTFMALMARGREEEAAPLLQAFEAHPSTQQAAAELGPAIAARWKLARELQRISKFDDFLGRAVARAIVAGNLLNACESAQLSLDEHGKAMVRFMSEQSPTIWNELGPHLRERETAARGFRLPTSGWPWMGSLFIVFHVLKACFVFGGPSAVSHVAEPPRLIVPPPSLPPESVRAPLPPQWPPQAIPEEPKVADERQSVGSWAAVEFAAKLGDCQMVREQWPLYRAAVANVHVEPALEASRRNLVLRQCAELRDLVEP